MPRRQGAETLTATAASHAPLLSFSYLPPTPRHPLAFSPFLISPGLPAFSAVCSEAGLCLLSRYSFSYYLGYFQLLLRVFRRISSGEKQRGLQRQTCIHDLEPHPGNLFIFSAAPLQAAATVSWPDSWAFTVGFWGAGHAFRQAVSKFSQI